MPKIVHDEDIFKAVIQVVTERGYAGATTKQMAEAAGVSEVTLFRKFDSKAALVRQAVAALLEQTDFPAAAAYTGNVQTDLERVVQVYQESAVQQGPFIFVLLAEMQRYPELAEVMDMPAGVFGRISELLVVYQKEGVLSQEHPMHALSALLGPLIYAGMMRRTKAGASIPPLDLKAHVDRFLGGRQERPYSW